MARAQGKARGMARALARGMARALARVGRRAQAVWGLWVLGPWQAWLSGRPQSRKSDQEYGSYEQCGDGSSHGVPHFRSGFISGWQEAIKTARCHGNPEGFPNPPAVVRRRRSRRATHATMQDPCRVPGDLSGEENS